MGRVTVERDVECASDPAKLWRIITDTERLNRAIGLGKIVLSETDDESAARYVVNTVSGGFPLEYEERPYEWVENRCFSVKRVVRKGLAESILNAFTVSISDAGATKLKIKVEVEPKYGVLSPIMRMQVRRFVERIAKEFKQIDQALAAGKDGEFTLQKPRLEWAPFERAAQALLARVTEDEKAAATRLIDFVSAAPDVEVDRLRPFELADQWGLDRRGVLALCLHAVVAGLLELNWDIVCPSCRTVSKRMRALEELDEHGGCHLCDISFDLALDQAIEATFRPARGLRELDEGPYCIGGPAQTPHVFAQMILEPDGEVEIPAPHHAGRYRLFVRGGLKAAVEIAEAAPEETRLEVKESAIEPATVAVQLSGRLVVHQTGASERHVKLERIEWVSQAATAAELGTLPEFRRMFAKEVLRPGLTLSIAKVALLFTDLTDSTAMYSAMGDARAFKIVQDHFEVLSQVIEAHDGVLVKTIGDAVMAAFTSDSHAVEAAVRIHRAFRDWRTGHAEASGIRLKVGVHGGPCYAVTANGLLDYFGQTVNVAARLQGQAGPGEVILAEALADEAKASGWLQGADIVERFEASLKGVDELVRVARVVADHRDSYAPPAAVEPAKKTG